MKKKRDIWEIIQLIGGLAVTGLTIYFLFERLRQQKLAQKAGKAQKQPDNKNIGVILE